MLQQILIALDQLCNAAAVRAAQERKAPFVNPTQGQ
jgi:hypothetical protein